MKTESYHNKPGKPEDYSTLCPPDLYKYFIGTMFKGAKLSEEEIEYIRTSFAEYLEGCNFTPEQKKNVLPKNEFDVMLNMHHPLRTNGFPPGYVIHFTEFVKKTKKILEKPCEDVIHHMCLHFSFIHGCKKCIGKEFKFKRETI